MTRAEADNLPDPEAQRAAMEPLFGELRDFMDRRITEISAEVSASVQLLGLDQDNLAGQISATHERIAGMGAGAQPGKHSPSEELEAAIQATEAAANTILEAAEAIQDWLEKGSGRPDGLPAISERVNAIFAACSFQDLTGQRIDRAVRDLQRVEAILEDILPANAPHRADTASTKGDFQGVAQSASALKAGSDLAPDEIDRLLRG
jgi:chemotaxis protein CheZ